MNEAPILIGYLPLILLERHGVPSIVEAMTVAPRACLDPGTQVGVTDVVFPPEPLALRSGGQGHIGSVKICCCDNSTSIH